MNTKWKWTSIAVLAVLAGSAMHAHAQESDHPSGAPMVVGSDFGVAPWMISGVAGPEGFGADLINEVGKRLGRPVEIVDINFSGIFAALAAKRIEFIVTALNITAERAESMLYTEPLFATGLGFVIRAGDEWGGFEGLDGKAVAVNRGAISDTWATANAEKYGFEVQRYDNFPDGVQALLTNRVVAAINEIPVVTYAAKINPAIKVAYRDFSGRNFAYAFRPESVEYRNKVEAALECMKKDGTIAGLFEKWYGDDPATNEPLTTVYPGFGAPGFKGYDETPHEPAC